jgi:alkylation response protein AidB-like acyl-CoA dehydrogenase
VRLDPDDDALTFGSSVHELLAAQCDSEALRAAWDDPDGRVPGVWSGLAELGVPAVLVPESDGGLGLDLRALLPALVESGRAALPEPIVETMVGTALLAAAGGPVAQRWLPEIAAGQATVAVGLGPGELVGGVGWADLYLVRDAAVVRALEPGEVEAREEPTIDRGVRLGTLGWADGTGVGIEGADPDAAFDLGAVAAAAQQIGVATAMLDMGVRYALQREQFGAVIGSFQAIKHQLADAYVAIEFARPVLARAVWSVATSAPTRARDASHAKYAAAGAADRAARTALQVHAGIGYTYEHDLHMWMKRSWTLTSLWGTPAWHKARITALLLGSGDHARPEGGS